MTQHPEIFVVTGGAGFIGSHLAEAVLAAGAQLRIVDDLSSGRRENIPPGAELIEGDAGDPALMRRVLTGAAGCFHLAAIASVERSNRDWLAAHRVNQSATVAVFEAARDVAAAEGRAPPPVVWASSAAIYGRQERMPIPEEAQPAPLSPYGVDKLCCEAHGRVAASLFGVSNTALRLFNVYGPRQDAASPYSGVIAAFSRRLGAGEPIEIHGDGGQLRDFVYVADVVEAFRAAMAQRLAAPEPGFDRINICRGAAVSLLDLADAAARACGRDAERRFGPPRAGDIRESVGDPQRMRAVLGVTARTELLHGLTTTIRSFQT